MSLRRDIHVRSIHLYRERTRMNTMQWHTVPHVGRPPRITLTWTLCECASKGYHRKYLKTWKWLMWIPAAQLTDHGFLLKCWSIIE
ncbi:hypothetical protein COOONC_00260 [Cooperia oncophora]